MKKQTQFIHGGRPDIKLATAVNPDITRASTLLFEHAEDLYRKDVRSYGRHGSSAHDVLCDLFTQLEYGVATSLFPSGLSACVFAILSHLKSGDHVLMTDSAYGPTVAFGANFLKKMNIECERYDPNIGAGISKRFRPNTRLILMESPGSLTLEVQDIPAICRAAQKEDIITVVDNTWSAGLSLNPLQLGADICVHSASKYFGGHSDLLFGAVISKSQTHAHAIVQTAKYFGNATSPDEVYQVLRGFRTIVTRFSQQAQTSLYLADWLCDHPLVERVLHPAHPSHPDHEIWARDFKGGGGVFSFILKPTDEAKVVAFINKLKLFGVGFSFGGFESLAIHCDPQIKRDHATKLSGPLVRLACGLEDKDDLKADIKQAFDVFKP